MTTKVKVFMSGADHPDGLENDINEFLAENEVEIVDIKFNGSFFYNQKDGDYDGGFAAMLIYRDL